MTRVIVDPNAGFCRGVRRAIRGAERLLAVEQSGRVLSYGQLVHNQEVTDYLAQRGLENAESLEQVGAGDRVVLRTHGISPQEQGLLRSRGVKIADFTCPRVKEVHRQIREKLEAGYRIVIVGDHRHAEVRAHLGYAGDNGMVISDPEDLHRLQPGEKIALFAQTTITPQTFREVVDALEGRGFEICVVNTLCPFVLKRQRWIEKYSRLAAASLILGGKNSSNTRKLYAIASANGPAYHLSAAGQLDLPEILKHPLVALTAGASTPDHTIEQVLARLQEAGVLIQKP